MARNSGSVASMTGFARQEGGDGRLTWMWEVKSVNGRGLDVRCRLPSGHEGLEAAARAAAQRALLRHSKKCLKAINR